MKHQFDVNLREIVHLLSSKLYRSSDVVVRELIQNAYDAIRQRYGTAPGEVGRIDIQANPGSHTLRFTDNGTGMDESELSKHLSTLGEGIKKTQDRSTADSAPIGEFGIGFFSAFFIAHKIVVRTRKENAAGGHLWTSTGVEGYEVVADPQPLASAGTEVTLHLDPASHRYATAQTVRRLVDHFCAFLDCPVYVNDPGEPVNVQKYAWELENESDREEWVHTHLNAEAIFHKAGSAKAGRMLFHYVLSCGPTLADSRELVHCKRIFVTESLLFLPDYLRFVDVLVAANDLQLNLGREDVQADSTFSLIRERVTELVLDWLGELARKRRKDERFAKIIAKKQELFKSRAMEDPLLFNKIYPYLLFPLVGDDPAGVEEYLSRQTLIPRTLICTRKRGKGDATAGDEVRLLLRVCEEKGIPVYEICDEQDDELLRRIATKHRARKVRVTDCRELLRPVEGEVDEPLDRVRRNFDFFFHVKSRLVEFPPPDVPLTTSGQEILLNSSNGFLRRLGNFKAENDALRPLYHALMGILRSLEKTTVETAALNEIIHSVVDGLTQWGEAAERAEVSRRRLASLTDRWWTGPVPLTGLKRGRPFPHGGREYSMRCFVVRPFATGYLDVYNVVVSTCAEFGVFAHDAGDPETREILAKVCRFIDACDFAIADVSENNPNVLFELGLVMARRKPVIILSSNDRREASGVTIPTDIIGIERIDYNNVTEDLRRKLQRILKSAGGRDAIQPESEAE